MAASFTLPTVLANLAAGNQALSLIDGDFSTLAAPLLSLNTYSNYYTDVGAANAYAITVSAPQTVSQAAGLRVQFIAANANTGASTLQINALAVKNIKNLNGSALSAGQIPANAIVDVMYDGTQYMLLNSYSTVIPQNSQSVNYTTVLTDAGKHLLHPTADNNPRTFTIDSNANVAYPIGTTITFVNQINTLSIAITSDTMTLAGAATTGTRTLAASGIATAMKIASANWIISGVGLA